MRKFSLKRLKQYFLLVGILPIAIITFLSDYLHLKNLGYFNSFEYLHEGLVSFNVILIYFYLRSFKIFSEQNVKKICFTLLSIWLLFTFWFLF